MVTEVFGNLVISSQFPLEPKSSINFFQIKTISKINIMNEQTIPELQYPLTHTHPQPIHY
jgi:hypothetical protein